MKTLTALLIALLLSSCSKEPGTTAEEMRTICLDGVVYYYFLSGCGGGRTGYMSVKFNRDSKVVLCD